MAEDGEQPHLDQIDGWPMPEEQDAWHGDPAAELQLRAAYGSGRLHHAWLIGGPRGIGKATLAFRFARFVLAHPDPGKIDPARPGIAVAADHPAFRQVAAGAHPNLLVLRRPYDERAGRFKTELTVDEVRRTIPFFGSTAGGPGWRIAIVDAADEMNNSAANALLKMLEEPPRRALFLLVSHAPGRLLPTIRSRCRRLDLAPLPTSAIATALAANPVTGQAAATDLALAARLGEGSLRQAIRLADVDGAGLYREFLQVVANLPELDIAALHNFADRLTRRGAEDSYDAFFDLLQAWLIRRVRGEPEPDDSVATAAAARGAPLASWAEVWEKVGRSFTLTDALNLDRKQFVLSSVMTLARATRM